MRSHLVRSGLVALGLVAGATASSANGLALLVALDCPGLAFPRQDGACLEVEDLAARGGVTLVGGRTGPALVHSDLVVATFGPGGPTLVLPAQEVDIPTGSLGARR